MSPLALNVGCLLFLLVGRMRRYFLAARNRLDVLRDRRALLGGAFHPTEERFR